MSEQIVTGKKYRILADAANRVWHRISFWTKASDVELNNGKSVETFYSDYTTTSGTVSSLSTTVSGLNTTVSGLSTTVAGLSTTVAGLSSGSLTDNQKTAASNTYTTNASGGTTYGHKAWFGTLAQYNAIGTKDANTYYYIKQ